jgi:hypothetical protein
VDQLWLEVGIQLLPQSMDVDVDEIRCAEVGPAPDRRANLGTREDFSRMAE